MVKTGKGWPEKPKISLHHIPNRKVVQAEFVFKPYSG